MLEQRLHQVAAPALRGHRQRQPPAARLVRVRPELRHQHADQLHVLPPVRRALLGQRQHLQEHPRAPSDLRGALFLRRLQQRLHVLVPDCLRQRVRVHRLHIVGILRAPAVPVHAPTVPLDPHPPVRVLLRPAHHLSLVARPPVLAAPLPARPALDPRPRHQLLPAHRARCQRPRGRRAALPRADQHRGPALGPGVVAAAHAGLLDARDLGAAQALQADLELRAAPLAGIEARARAERDLILAQLVVLQQLPQLHLLHVLLHHPVAQPPLQVAVLHHQPHAPAPPGPRLVLPLRLVSFRDAVQQRVHPRQHTLCPHLVAFERKRPRDAVKEQRLARRAASSLALLSLLALVLVLVALHADALAGGSDELLDNLRRELADGGEEGDNEGMDAGVAGGGEEEEEARGHRAVVLHERREHCVAVGAREAREGLHEGGQRREHGLDDGGVVLLEELAELPELRRDLPQVRDARRGRRRDEERERADRGVQVHCRQLPARARKPGVVVRDLHQRVEVRNEAHDRRDPLLARRVRQPRRHRAHHQLVQHRKRLLHQLARQAAPVVVFGQRRNPLHKRWDDVSGFQRHAVPISVPIFRHGRALVETAVEEG
mmetsp:Transcript_2894/g.6766  ORF Transcript_2894/g.6766 Transcript_2894/m.6766 type:complete len:604 (-) Transcript_2894:656-2467(-)